MFCVNNVKIDFGVKLELELLYPLKTVAFGSFEGKWAGYFLNKRLSNFKIEEQGVGVSDWKILLLGCDDTKKKRMIDYALSLHDSQSFAQLTF